MLPTAELFLTVALHTQPRPVRRSRSVETIVRTTSAVVALAVATIAPASALDKAREGAADDPAARAPLLTCALVGPVGLEPTTHGVIEACGLRVNGAGQGPGG